MFIALPFLDINQLTNTGLLGIMCASMVAMVLLNLLDEIVETCMLSRSKKEAGSGDDRERTLSE